MLPHFKEFIKLIYCYEKIYIFLKMKFLKFKKAPKCVLTYFTVPGQNFLSSKISSLWILPSYLYTLHLKCAWAPSLHFILLLPVWGYCSFIHSDSCSPCCHLIFSQRWLKLEITSLYMSTIRSLNNGQSCNVILVHIHNAHQIKIFKQFL